MSDSGKIEAFEQAMKNLCVAYDEQIAEMHEEYVAMCKKMVSFYVALEKIATSASADAAKLASDALERNKKAA